MGTVTGTSQAEESRLAIWQYVARDNLDAADRLIRRIDERCQFYADSPLLGNVREDLGHGIRRFHVGNYEVLYRPTASSCCWWSMRRATFRPSSGMRFPK